MKQGRELDALIAEKVMGISAWQSDADAWTVKDGTLYSDLPHYSTDIAAAWEVVEKLNALDLGDFILKRVNVAAGMNWMAGIAGNENLEYGDTAPHAICLAALKAVGHSLE